MNNSRSENLTYKRLQTMPIVQQKDRHRFGKRTLPFLALMLIAFAGVSKRWKKSPQEGVLKFLVRAFFDLFIMMME